MDHLRKKCTFPKFANFGHKVSKVSTLELYSSVDICARKKNKTSFGNLRMSTLKTGK